MFKLLLTKKDIFIPKDNLLIKAETYRRSEDNMVDRLENVLRKDHNVCTINLQKGSNQFKKTKWVTKYLIYLPAKLSLVFSSHSDSYDF